MACFIPQVHGSTIPNRTWTAELIHTTKQCTIGTPFVFEPSHADARIDALATTFCTFYLTRGHVSLSKKSHIVLFGV